jgi:hypothetical protein
MYVRNTENMPVISIYRAYAMKLPDFIVQHVYNDFGNVSKIEKFFFSCAKDLLRTTGVQILTQILQLAHGTPLRRTSCAHIEGYCFKLKLVCCVTDT